MDTSKTTIIIAVLLCSLHKISGRPPLRGSTTEEEATQTSQFSRESIQTLIERLRASQNNYYDDSLLQNPSDVPIRHVAPNEYNHIDNGPVPPNRTDSDLTLGAFLGENSESLHSRQDSSPQVGRGYLPDAPGVAQNWPGGASVSQLFPETASSNRDLDDSKNSDPMSENSASRGSQDTDLQRPDWGDVITPNYTTNERFPDTRLPRCDMIGPGDCPSEPGYESTETRTQEEIEKDLWHPEHTTREEWLKCNGMDCKEKEMAEDLMELLQYELTRSEYQPPEAGLPMKRCDTDHCRKMLTMLGCAKFTVPQLQDMLTSLRVRRDLDFPNPREEPDTDGGPKGSQRQKRKLIDFKVQNFQKWPANEPIRYMFDGTHDFREQQIIRDAFQHWMDNTCLQFQELNRAYDYMYRGQINYIMITSEKQGCFAYIGLVPNYKPQQLNLEDKCLKDFGVPVHEIGHALGYWHEHQRVDRDLFIQIMWNDVGSYLDQFDRALGSTIQPCPYDYTSVMHYAPEDGSTAGNAVILASDPLYQKSMGQRVELSFLDTKCINDAYCSDVCRNQPLRGGVCAHSGYQDPKNCYQCRCPDGLGGQFCNDVEPGTSGCGGVMTLQQGGQAQTITSPSYPQPYPENYKCNWKITAPTGCKVQISFNSFDSFGIYAHDQGQCYHWLEVKYKSDFGKAGPRFCGNNVGNIRELTSETNEMIITFRSNYTVPRSIFTGQPTTRYQLVGFRAQISLVQCVGNPVTPPPSGGDCQFFQTYQCRNQATCVGDRSSPNGFRCNCATGYTGTYCETQCPNFNCNPTPGPNPVEAGCPRAIDLVFVLDSSGSVQWWNWPKMLQVVINLVDQLTIAYDAVWVGVVIFGDDANVAIALGTLNDKESLKTAIRNLSYRPQWTNTAAGLAMATQALNSGRFNAPNKAILITDGPSNRNSFLTLNNAQTLRNANTEIYAVAVGGNTDQTELQGITGSPNNIINVVAGFEALNDFATSTLVLNTMCGTSGGGGGGGGGGSGQVSFTCGFETDLCNMVQGNPSFTFTRLEGDTPSYGTGPNSAGQGRYFAYIETSYGRQKNERASLAIPSSALQSLTTPSSLCLRFKYHMYGQGIGTLRVNINNARESTFIRSGDLGNAWNNAAATLFNVNSRDQIIIEASTTNLDNVHIYQGDIAIDDIRLTSGQC